MSALRFSTRAKADLISIYRYSLRTWGRDQAETYAGVLESCFTGLATNPLLGRSADEIRKGVRRIEAGRHVIFYRLQLGAVVIITIQHDRRVPRLG